MATSGESPESLYRPLRSLPPSGTAAAARLSLASPLSACTDAHKQSVLRNVTRALFTTHTHARSLMQALTKWLDDRALCEWPCLHGLAVDHAPLFDWIYDCGSLCLVLQTGSTERSVL